MPGFGHCFAYIEWPAYSSARAQAFALVLSLTYWCFTAQILPRGTIVYCLSFHPRFRACVVVSVLRGCHYNFRPIGPISATVAITLAFLLLPIWLSCSEQLYWAFQFLCVRGFIVEVTVDAISLTLECCITVVLYSFFVRYFFSCNMFEHLFIFDKRKKFMHVI